jgi:hypothetical protein
VDRHVAAVAVEDEVGRLRLAAAADGAEGLVVDAALRQDVEQLLRRTGRTGGGEGTYR